MKAYPKIPELKIKENQQYDNIVVNADEIVLYGETYFNMKNKDSADAAGVSIGTIQRHKKLGRALVEPVKKLRDYLVKRREVEMNPENIQNQLNSIYEKLNDVMTDIKILMDKSTP